MQSIQTSNSLIEKSLESKCEGRLFVYIWMHTLSLSGKKYLIAKEYYTVINGVVYIIEGDGSKLTPSGDSLFEITTECRRVGVYNPSKKYKQVNKVYTYSEFKKLLKL